MSAEKNSSIFSLRKSGHLWAAALLIAGVAALNYFPVRKAVYSTYYGGSERYCPVCDTHLRRLLPTGNPVREDAECPICLSRERHRLMWLYLRDRTDLLDGKPKRLLHVAPEMGLGRRFQQAPNVDYLSGDLNSPDAMVKMDVTDIQYPENSFDVIFCSHVLEHVPNDRKAMRELYRVLKPGGWAMLQVPIARKTTFEDAGVTTEAERLRVFGQEDHVRIYGEDYVDRLEEAGFDVTMDKFILEFSDQDLLRMGLPGTDDYPADRYIYVCRKKAS